jgi:NAD(P)-dependent dehydrogenase (short-subunit alcohol dehydrogenase family)
VSLKQLMNLSGKVALITGGSRRLGLQMSEVLGESGAKLAVTARKQHELEAAAERLSSQGIEVMTCSADPSKTETLQGLVDSVMARHGHIDILANNAGATCGAPAEDHPAEAWHKVLNFNVNALFFLSRP